MVLKSKISIRQKISDADKSVEKCYICQQTPTLYSIFCEYCGPPKGPDFLPESQLTVFQTFLQLLLVFSLFAGYGIYKLNIPGPGNNPTVVKNTVLPQPMDLGLDSDFKIIHFINVSMANVRTKGIAGSPILMVLKQNEKVDILEEGKFWTKISFNGKIGYIGTKLLGSRVE